MDNKTLVHIVSEVAVIGCVSFYFQKKVGTLTEENKKLTAELEAIKKELLGMKNAVINHDRIIRLMMDDSEEDTSQRAPRFSSRPTAQYSSHNEQPSPSHDNPAKGRKRPVEKEELDFDVDELDNELKDEYEQLESERSQKNETSLKSSKNHNSSHNIKNIRGGATVELLDENICEGGVCPLNKK